MWEDPSQVFHRISTKKLTCTTWNFPPFYSAARVELGNAIPCKGQIHFSCSLSKWIGFQTCRIPQSPWAGLQTAQHVRKGERVSLMFLPKCLIYFSTRKYHKKATAFHRGQDHGNQLVISHLYGSLAFSKRRFHKTDKNLKREHTHLLFNIIT